VAEDQQGEPTARISSRRLRAALAIGLVAGAGLLTVWVERRPIATRFIDRELTRRGVPARYRVADLGLGRQRLTNVVIGDPRRPDLTADWVETRTEVGFGGVRLAGVRAGRVRLRGRLLDGRLSLGAVDRLLPPPSGAPFALPALDAAVADARATLATPLGAVGLRLAGRGVLNDGFAGRLRAIAPTLGRPGCAGTGLVADLAVQVTDAAPRIAGPVRADALACGGATVAGPRGAIDVVLSPALDRWRGSTDLSSGTVRHPALRAATARAQVRFAGTVAATGGRLALGLADARAAQISARGSALTGAFGVGRAPFFNGRLALRSAAVRASLPFPTTLRETPVAPVAAAGLAAARRALARFDADASVRLRQDRQGPSALVSTLSADAASGARLRLGGGEGLSWTRAGGVRLAAALSVGGGGLPALRTAVSRGPDGILRGTASSTRYAAGGGALTLAPTRFVLGPRSSRVAGGVILSGPLGDGRVEELSIPLDLRWSADGAWAAAPGCTRAAFRTLRVGGLDLDAGSAAVCATGPALLVGRGGRLRGGGRLLPIELTGRLGSSPVTLAAAGGRVTLADRRLTLSDPAVRLGGGDRVSRLDAVSLSVAPGAGGAAGRVEGLGGQLANVPLVVSEGAGDWRFAGGRLTLAGRATVSDAQGSPRFQPMHSRDLSLTLADNRIAVDGGLAEPISGVRVAGVAIRHDLGSGRGSADLTVPGIAFGDRLQPDRLTRLTFGVIADVKGVVSGAGRIDWGPAGVTSTATFRTAGLDLAAAFGPVTGLTGEIRFADLLALRSAPGQIVTIASINPGVPVTNGTVRYATLPDARVAVEGGRWPFAGGTLSLDPTLLDFSRPTDRRLTFHVAGVRAGEFLQQFDFENLNATGTFDGVLPMVFDESGGRIEAGSLRVREGGGTIAYAGELNRRNLGFWGDLAFQSLRSLRYRSLTVALNGPLAGEMVTDVRFAGVQQGQGARSNFLIRRLQRLPLVFNVRVTAPFRGLIDSAQSFYDPSRLIRRNLPALLQRQTDPTPAVQPPASEPKP